MTLTDKTKILSGKTKASQAQCNLDREADKTSTL